MAWQAEVGSGTSRATDYHDLFNKIVQMACSQHIATVAINAAGSGYVVGDILTINDSVFTNAEHLPARFEVTSVGGSGDITGLRISTSGAYAQQAASATVSAGGSGYAVGDVLQVSGGTNRLPAKFKVATLSGSAVATVTLFEGGGAYSATPSNPAATVGVGPAAYAGNDACTLTVTYNAFPSTLTNRPTSGGTGTSATIDVTFAETGWSVDGRDTNRRTENSLTNEKEVTLKGDASGKTNDPYVAMISYTRTSGIDTRYGIAMLGMTAHNSGIELYQQPGLAFGLNQSTNVLQGGGSFLHCDENQAQEMDFWLTVDDHRIAGVININPAAVNTDNGEYLHFHMGLMDPYGSESENPYAMFVFAASRELSLDPSASSTSITGIAECMAPISGNCPAQIYVAETAVWETLVNSRNNDSTQRTNVMWPRGNLDKVDDGTTGNATVGTGPIDMYDTWSKLGRGAPDKKLLPVPGTTDELWLFPLNPMLHQGGGGGYDIEDGPRGEVRGIFMVNATDDTGAQIANFSEDYITIGSDRYRVFHNHVHTSRYQYIAIKEDV